MEAGAGYPGHGCLPQVRGRAARGVSAAAACLVRLPRCPGARRAVEWLTAAHSSTTTRPRVSCTSTPSLTCRDPDSPWLPSSSRLQTRTSAADWFAAVNPAIYGALRRCWRQRRSAPDEQSEGCDDDQGRRRDLRAGDGRRSATAQVEPRGSQLSGWLRSTVEVVSVTVAPVSS